MNVYLVYVRDDYREHRGGVCVGIGLTHDGAQAIIRDYRRAVGTCYCDVVAAVKPC